jgi:hypothetical protein
MTEPSGPPSVSYGLTRKADAKPPDHFRAMIVNTIAVLEFLMAQKTGTPKVKQAMNNLRSMAGLPILEPQGGPSAEPPNPVG